MCVCIKCKIDLGKNKRPKFSMCGELKCDFGYPKYLDNINGNIKLTIPERLALSKVRPYIHMVKVIENDPNNKAYTGHSIRFEHDNKFNELTEQSNNKNYPDKDISEYLSILFIGSSDKKDKSSSDRKDLIKYGIPKSIIKIRKNVINSYAKGLIEHNQLFKNDNCIDINDDDINNIIKKVPIVI